VKERVKKEKREEKDEKGKKRITEMPPRSSKVNKFHTM